MGPQTGEVVELKSVISDDGWTTVCVLQSRAAIPEGGLEGPLIIEEYDSTTVVPPGWRIERAAWGTSADR